MKNYDLMALNGPRIWIQRPRKHIVNMVWSLGQRVFFCGYVIITKLFSISANIFNKTVGNYYQIFFSNTC